MLRTSAAATRGRRRTRNSPGRHAVLCLDGAGHAPGPNHISRFERPLAERRLQRTSSPTFFYSQPFSRAVRMASSRLFEPSLVMALER